MKALKIFFASSEVAPFAKTGGLADIANSLPKMFKLHGHDIRVIMPKYRFIPDRKYTLRDVIRLRDIELDFPNQDVVLSSTKSAFIDDSKVQIYFADIVEYFNQKSPYVDPKTGKDFPNNFERFAYFSFAALKTLKHLHWQPDVIHCNDWQTALIPVLLKTYFKDDPFYARIKTVLTIHNMAFQGIFPIKKAATIGLDKYPDLIGENGPLEFHNNLNLLKGGIYFADKITTVSPGYLQHLLENDENAFGLLQALQDRHKDLVGILNGIDVDIWNPEIDKNIPTNYSSESIADKVENRTELLNETGLKATADKPLIGFVARLTEQKGVHLIIENLENWIKDGYPLIILGSGERKYENQLKALAEKYPEKLYVKIGFDEKLAHKIQAGCDLFLMPSYFEPCGLTQLYSLRYGTLPLAFHTGGLIDTIIDLGKYPETGTGFLFESYDAQTLNTHFHEAVALFDDKEKWRAAQLRGMAQDFSWNKPVESFFDLFQNIIPTE
jgi:starch synthase